MNRCHPAARSDRQNSLRQPMQLTIQAFRHILILVTLLAVRAPVEASDNNKLEKIVHQNDLDGWHVEGTAHFDDKTGRHPVWTVANGEVSCAGHGFGYLR